MTTKVDFRTAQLLCSRICHDLVGPVGAINTAIELMNDDDDTMDAEALMVLAKSAVEANRKLTFFRSVFGLGASQGTTVETSSVVEQLNDLVASGKVTLQWAPGMPGVLSSVSSKVLMLLVYLAIDSLPRGGRIEVRVQSFSDGDAIACIAEGDSVILQDEAAKILEGGIAENELTARAIPSYVLMLLGKENGVKIEVSSPETGQIVLAALFANGLSG